MKLCELLNEIDLKTAVNFIQHGGMAPSQQQNQQQSNQNSSDTNNQNNQTSVGQQNNDSGNNSSNNSSGMVAPESGGLLTPAKSGAKINNPGNVKYSSTTARYPGVTGKSGQFCAFQAPEYGIAASMKRLSVYKANTLFQALSIYAPASDGNNPQQYAKVVQQRTGIDPYASINLKDAEILKKIIPGMLWMECNAQYSQDVINKAADIYKTIGGNS